MKVWENVMEFLKKKEKERKVEKYKHHSINLLKIFYEFDSDENLLTDEQVLIEMKKYLKKHLNIK